MFILKSPSIAASFKALANLYQYGNVFFAFTFNGLPSKKEGDFRFSLSISEK